ncbi:hypothetical protein [Streptomyces sp. NPDC057695]|uniref:hypothetical protein n=1 Tax=Streptomyces sp. NPDC057695 TaxID=3346217 RepID=UPI003683989D
MTALVQPLSGSRLLAYADAFGSPPRGEGPERADACPRRLRGDVDRPGFTAALALDGDTVSRLGDRLDHPVAVPHRPLPPADIRRARQAPHGPRGRPSPP